MYRATQAQRLEELASAIGVYHAKNPKRSRERILEAARDMMVQRPPLARDKERLKKTVAGMRGVKKQVRERKK